MADDEFDEPQRPVAVASGPARPVTTEPPTLYFTQDPVEHLRLRVTLRRQRAPGRNLREPATLKAMTLMRRAQANLEVTQSDLLGRRARPGLGDDFDAVSESKEQDAADEEAIAAERDNEPFDDGGDGGDDGDDRGDGRGGMHRRERAQRRQLRPGAPRTAGRRGGDEARQPSTLGDPSSLNASLVAGGPVGAGRGGVDDDLEIERVFEWQEKVFSAREILRFAHNQHRDQTALDAQYSREITAQLRSLYPEESSEEVSSRAFCTQQRGAMLCSKVDADGFVDPEEAASTVTSLREGLNPVARRVLASGGAHSLPPGSRPPQNFAVTALVDLPDSTNEIKNYRKAQQTGYERVLCRLRVFDNGTFEMAPPFHSRSAGLEGVERRLRRGAREDEEDAVEDGWHSFTSPKGVTYTYRIENASAGDDRSFLASKAKELSEELRVRELDLLQNRLAMDFEKPPPSSHLRVNVFGEVVSARGFDAENVFVDYELVLPDGWVWSPRDAARRDSASSHVASCILESTPNAPDTRVFYLSFPFEWELMAAAGRLLRWPSLVFEVSSLDSWDRHRAAGYGHINLPAEPGMHELSARAWRPAGSIRQQMQRFFVGGAPSLQERRLAGPPTEFPFRFKSSYGFATETAGSLQFRFHIVITAAPQLSEVERLLASTARATASPRSPARPDSPSLFRGELKQRWSRARERVQELVSKPQ